MFNDTVYSCTHYFLWSHFYMIKPQCLQVESAADMFNQAAYSCTHYVLWIHLYMIKPQSVQVESAADMFNQAAYSCTHYSLWSHLHIIKPQSLQVGRATHLFNHAAFSCIHYSLWSNLYIITENLIRLGVQLMFNYAAFPCTHYFVLSYLHIIKPQTTVSLGWECSSHVKLCCLLLHPLLFVELSSHNRATDNSPFRLGVQLTLKQNFIFIILLYFLLFFFSVTFLLPLTRCLIIKPKTISSVWKHSSYVQSSCLFLLPLFFVDSSSLSSCYLQRLSPPSHLYIIRPQSLQARSSASVLNQAAYSCTHHFLWSYLDHNQSTENLFRLGAQLICLMVLLIPAPITFCRVIFT